MSKDSYSYIYECFSIDNADQCLFVNVRTSSLINSIHQIIYYVVLYMVDSDWRILSCLFFSLVYYVRLICSFILCNFYCATRMHSAYMPWKDVRLSVCPSVRHTPVLCLNGYTYPQFFSPSGSPTILAFPYQTGWRYSDGNSPNGGVECKRYDKMTIFSQISRSISETAIVRWAYTARQFVSIEFSIHPYNI